VRTIEQVVADLEAWLETMRGPDGYGGPVVHWWQNCLNFTGAGLDWRYEGIIGGYLTLWQRTGQARWLEKARRAGNDLVYGQLPDGNFRDSCFEQNPYSGGTPHEAAADLALLELATALREIGDADWERFGEAAKRNLRCYYLERLWDEAAGSFHDHPETPSLVPNKACTVAEALFGWAALYDTDEPIERYALPTLRAVVALQQMESPHLHGAIAQNRIGDQVVEKYFPYYIARCIPALLEAYDFTGEQHWLDRAAAALAFIGRQVDEEGLLPQVIYRRGTNRYPQWLAPLGDVLRAAGLLAPYGVTFPHETVRSALLAGRLPSGGFATGRGFARQLRQDGAGDTLPDFRDALPVAGWCDKAFHYLVGGLELGRRLPPPDTAQVAVLCQLRGRPAVWTEKPDEMRLESGDKTVYAWRKGEPWAEMAAREVAWI
jgi:hypothetical protein